MTNQSPMQYYEILSQYQQAQLFLAALRLDIFSRLEQPITAHRLAGETGFNENKLSWLLLALCSCGLIEKKDNGYINTPEASKFLSKSMPHYLGETLLFREQMTSLAQLKQQFLTDEVANPQYDFARLAKVVVPEMYTTGRVNAFISEVETLYPDKNSRLSILDLGGGSGTLAIEFAKIYPNSNAVVFETPTVAPVAKEMIERHRLTQSISVMEGDFNKDSFGNAHDLIIASGILDFVTCGLKNFIAKIADALTDNGYLLLIGRFTEAEMSKQENILSWLSGYMNGLSPPPSKESIEIELKNLCIYPVRSMQAGRFSGYLYQKTTKMSGGENGRSEDG